MTHTTTEPRIRVRLTATELRRADRKRERRNARMECRKLKLSKGTGETE